MTAEKDFNVIKDTANDTEESTSVVDKDKTTEWSDLHYKSRPVSPASENNLYFTEIINKSGFR